MNRLNAIRLTLGVSALVAIAGSALASGLGAAANYNMFVRNDVFTQWSDVEGKVAVGRDWSSDGYSVGLLDQGGNALIAGRNIRYNSGSIYGNAVYGNSANITSTGFQAGGSAIQGSPINFTSAFAGLDAISTSISQAANTGTAYQPWSTLNFDVTSGLNVFTVTDAQLNNASDIRFNGASSTSTVLINVIASNVGGQTRVNFKNYGYGLNGLSRNRLLWNVNNADRVQYDYLEGSLLAANSDVYTGWGVLQGQVVARNWYGNSQTNLHLFNGELPAQPVPEPATMVALGIGAMALIRRRKAAK